MQNKSQWLHSSLSAKSFRSFMLLLVMMFTTSTAWARKATFNEYVLQSWMLGINENTPFTLTFTSEEKLYEICDGAELTAEGLGMINDLYIYSTGSHTVTNIEGEEVDCYNYYLIYPGWSDGIEAPEDCSWLFAYLSNLVSVTFDNFDTGNVTDMNNMFQSCSSLTSLNLSNFDTSNVTDMSYMFQSCSSLTSLDLSNFDTSNVTDMYYMFSDCSSLTSLDLSNFDTSNVTRMSFMFQSCSSLTSLDLSNFDTSNVTGMSYMFDGCSSLTSLNLSNFDNSNVTAMSYMFNNCSSLTALNLSNFNTSKVETMQSMFDGCSSLTSLNLSNFNTSKVTDMCQMFRDCSSLTSLNISNFNTSNVTAMFYMFKNCSSLTSLTIGNFDMHNVESAGSMFKDTPKLKTLTLKSVPNLKDGTFNSKFTGEGVIVKYELDDNSEICNTGNYIPAVTAPASYSRTMANQWGTIVLPFDVDTSKENPYDFYKISSVSGDELTLSKITSTLSAGTPALIRLYDNVVSGSPYELNITAKDNNMNVSDDLTQSTGSLSLIGAYDYKDITAEAGYIIANNAFWSIQDIKGSNKVYCAPFRAYIAGTASESRLRISTADETTGIAALDALNSADAVYYDINGRKQTGLKNGMNVIKANGKTMKVIVK